MKRARQLIAMLLLLAFVASNTALFPVALAAGAWMDHDHAIGFGFEDGHLDLVLSHHDDEAHIASLRADSQHNHQHGWAVGMLVALAEAPALDGDHVIHFTFSRQVSTEHDSAALPVTTPTDALCPPAAQLVTLTTRPAILLVAAARPPPVSQLLLSLRTTVLVV